MPKTIPYVMYSQSDETLKGFAEYIRQKLSTPTGKADLMREYQHTCEMIESQNARKMAV